MRVAALLTSGSTIAVIRREQRGQTYYLFPGGTVEPGETELDALKREVMEELGLQIEPGPLVAEVHFGDRRQKYFQAEQRGGTFGEGTGAEFTRGYQQQHGSYSPEWLPIDQLLTLDVRPRGVAKLIVRHQGAWPCESVVIHEHRPAGEQEAQASAHAPGISLTAE